MEEQRLDVSAFWSANPKPQTIVDIVAIEPETVKCRKHYGFSVPERLDPDKHGHIDAAKPGMHRYVDKWDNQEYQPGLPHWQLAKGSEMDEGGYDDYAMSWTLDNCSAKRWDTVTVSLYACGNDEAAGTIADDGVEHVGDLRVDLKGVNWGEIPRRYASDNRSILYRFDATVRMGFADDSGRLVLKLLRNGQELGKAIFEGQ